VPADGIDYLLCVRRVYLDGFLWETAASTSGIDAVDRTTSTQLLWEDDRVVGVELDGPAGRCTVRCELLVGADGRGSFVAQAVGADETDIVEPGRYWYYGYFAGARLPDPVEMTESDTDTETVVAMPTNDNLLMVVLSAYNEDFQEFRRDHRTNYLARVHAHPGIERMISGARLDTPVFGFSGVRGYYRTIHGPGWALVGDAAHQKDPLVARGINEALRQAEWLADALVDGISASGLDRYATMLRERTWGRYLNGQMLMRPDRYMTPEQGAKLSRELATPEGLSQYLRVEYDDSLTFETYFSEP
jgi:flavin-dependent dehydrogenase